eukprot:TRINITY_DN17693_c0_g1_i3.p1 TRINITY_DN17693_c0_g1~~TRINITY_DN17693_c0_g1_i3.p1  ORF type:complete len:201 (-),score=40.97 TRINITY_DN17693_c0_g1_i3:576-1178(-)
MELEFQGAQLRMQPKQQWWDNKKISKENKDEDYFDSETEVPKRVGGTNKDETAVPKIEIEKGTFIRFVFEELTEEQANKLAECHRSMIKDSFGGKEMVANVQWQQENNKNKEGMVRFKNAAALQEILKKNEIEGSSGQMKVCGFVANVRILEGDEEEKEIAQTIEIIQQSQQKDNQRDRANNKRRGGFPGRGKNKRGRNK